MSFLILALAFLVVFLFSRVRIVPQAENWVVERFGNAGIAQSRIEFHQSAVFEDKHENRYTRTGARSSSAGHHTEDNAWSKSMESSFIKSSIRINILRHSGPASGQYRTWP